MMPPEAAVEHFVNAMSGLHHTLLNTDQSPHASLTARDLRSVRCAETAMFCRVRVTASRRCYMLMRITRSLRSFDDRNAAALRVQSKAFPSCYRDRRHSQSRTILSFADLLSSTSRRPLMKCRDALFIALVAMVRRCRCAGKRPNDLGRKLARCPSPRAATCGRGARQPSHVGLRRPPVAARVTSLPNVQQRVPGHFAQMLQL
jgi:hypothetical protein